MLARTAITTITMACGMVLAGCSLGPKQGLAPFTSDGCSLFPDNYLHQEGSWLTCCIEHDKTYWQGGSKDQRKQSDLALKHCVDEQTGDSALAQTMYNGVRLGGSAYFPTTYRWGYGWPYNRGYQTLSKAEAQLANQLLQDWEWQQSVAEQSP